MSTELVNLRSSAKAKLPEVYRRAKTALANCDRLDECKDWGDKAMALASYARQADDQSLFNMAARIQVRAVDRCGQLLKEFDARGDHRKSAGAGTSSQREMAEGAGMSRRQQLTAIRVANVPREEFEALVERGHPATVTMLAERGKKSRPELFFDLEGRDPEDFKKATRAQSSIDFFLEAADEIPAEIVARGSLAHEVAPLLESIERATAWLHKLKNALKGNRHETISLISRSRSDHPDPERSR